MEEKNQRAKELEERLSALVKENLSKQDIDEIALILDELKTLIPEEPEKTKQAWQEFLKAAELRRKVDYYMGLPYRVKIEEDKEEGGYALCFPELPGCITCAENIEQGKHRLEDAKREWFIACIESGAKIPVPEGDNWQSFVEGLGSFTDNIFENGREQVDQEEREVL